MDAQERRVSVLHGIKARVDRPRHNDKTGPAFDIQIVRRGILPKVLKRRNIMSNNEVVYSSELQIRFDQHSDGGVTWYVNPDKSVSDTYERSHEELAAAGVPLAILGIRLLSEFCDANLMDLALGRASGYLWKAYAQRLESEAEFASNEFEGSVVTDSGEEVAIH